MSKDEIRQTVADFGTAARNALEAGFDGVQIQAKFLYLIAQFLDSGTNLRKDEYGGYHLPLYQGKAVTPTPLKDIFTPIWAGP